MKKIWAGLFVLVILLSCTIAVFATDNELEILPAEYAVGDVDMDGKVNVKDATLVQKSIAGLVTLTDKQTFLADADLDTNVNIKDATYIQKQVAGLVKPMVPSNPAESTTVPTEVPTADFTEVPTYMPTDAPTEAPTHAPTEAPTQAPTEEPTESATKDINKPIELPFVPAL